VKVIARFESASTGNSRNRTDTTPGRNRHIRPPHGTSTPYRCPHRSQHIADRKRRAHAPRVHAMAPSRPHSTSAPATGRAHRRRTQSGPKGSTRIASVSSRFFLSGTCCEARPNDPTMHRGFGGLRGHLPYTRIKNNRQENNLQLTPNRINHTYSYSFVQRSRNFIKKELS